MNKIYSDSKLVMFDEDNMPLDDEQLLLDWDYSKNEKGPNEYTKQTNTYVYFYFQFFLSTKSIFGRFLHSS